MGMEMTIGIPARSVKDRSSFSGIWQRDNRLCAIKDRASLARIWQRRYRCMFLTGFSSAYQGVRVWVNGMVIHGYLPVDCSLQCMLCCCLVCKGLPEVFSDAESHILLQ